ncbi:MAG: hypothetical protein Q8865_10450 [Bacillota bacterium]|nr:hypothetical protein [Bacillota bacterium]
MGGQACRRAGQTIKGSKMGAYRKLWVINMLDKLGVAVDDGVNALIEATVKALNDTAEKAASEIENKADSLKNEATAADTPNIIPDGTPVKAEISE